MKQPDLKIITLFCLSFKGEFKNYFFIMLKLVSIFQLI